MQPQSMFPKRLSLRFSFPECAREALSWEGRVSVTERSGGRSHEPPSTGAPSQRKACAATPKKTTTMDYLDQWDYQKLEMETQNEMFMKMQAMCFRKCVKKTKDSDFPIGEMSCSDRCVSKFFETHKILMAEFETF